MSRAWLGIVGLSLAACPQVDPPDRGPARHQNDCLVVPDGAIELGPVDLVGDYDPQDPPRLETSLEIANDCDVAFSTGVPQLRVMAGPAINQLTGLPVLQAVQTASVRVGAGSTAVLPFTFEPEVAGATRAELLFESFDPPVRTTYELVATARAAVIRAESPASLLVPIGCEEVFDVVFENQGNLDAELIELGAFPDASPFSLVDGTTLPMVIPAGGSLALPVRFTPSEVKLQEHTLLFTTDAWVTPRRSRQESVRIAHMGLYEAPCE